MATAMVVATIVNTTMSEAGFRQHMVEQLRVNNRRLLDKLADADDDADVVTAVLNVDEFLTYMIRRFPTTVDTAFSSDTLLESAPATKEIEGSVDLKAMSEGEFMDFMLMQIESGKVEPLVKFSEQEWTYGMDDGMDDARDDEGDIGEDISHYPFFY